MNWINEFNFCPGTYQHYKGDYYVAIDIITHMDNAAGKMDPLPVPLVVYRDLHAIIQHVNGKPSQAHMRFARPLSEFIGTVEHNGNIVKRFTKI